jgi:hypothetical protein
LAIVVELNLFEVRPHPDVVRHEHRQVGAGLCEFTHCSAELNDTPRLVCRDNRVRKIELRLVALSLAQAKVRDRAVALRPQRLDLPLRQREGCLRTLYCSLLLTQPRGVPLGVLNGARESRRRQLLVALRLLLSKHQRRLRLVDLCLIGMDLRLLHNDLRVDILDVGPRGGDLSLSLGKRIAVITVVDPRDHLAGGDVLVVGDRDRGEVTRHLWSDRELTRGDERVVR